MTTVTKTKWAVKFRVDNAIDGRYEYLVWHRNRYSLGLFRLAIFDTRAEARQYIAETYGYIRDRPDLRAKPHGWKMPIPVKVRVTVEEIGS